MENTMTFKELMENEEVQQQMVQMKAIMEKDPVVVKMVEAAKTAEDVFEITKRYVQVKWEDFKRVFMESVSYFSDSKAELNDEVLDHVAGGWNWDFIGTKKWSCILGCVVGVAIAAVGTGIGVLAAVVSGPIGGVAGFGLAVGSMAMGANIVAKNVEVLEKL